MTSSPYSRRLMNGLQVCSTMPEHAAQLQDLQVAVFPTLADAERFKAEHYRKHLELFAAGQFVVQDGSRVVGATSTIRMDFDFAHPNHTFSEIIQGGWLTSHNPTGAWLYGADMGTHPEYRRRGIARALYAARHHTVRQLNLLGQLTVGMLAGYGARKHELSAQEYYDELVAGRLRDPTISAQMAIGFEPRGLIAGYISDPVCDSYGVCLVLDAAVEVAAE